MSRSLKKTPAGGICSGSEKKDKQLANKAFRRLSKTLISKGEYEKLPIKLAEIVDVWSMTKDGKSYYIDAPLYYLRK